ncbi:MAG: toprim domain-containing protein, partial [Chthoniobacterales bacterium]|nr:toprim domain-containing protein [Chthoniobacterales bacterium]
ASNWQIGFAPESWDALLQWALDRGYRRAHLAQSGLVKARDENRPDGEVYDRFRGRIMFPICNDVGEVIAFSGRILSTERETAKYLNSPETPLFRKGGVLFGLHKSKRALIEANSAIVCEGQLDLITLFEAGIANVVAPQGTAFTDSHARVLKRFVTEIVLCFDADAAGQKASKRSLETLLQSYGVQGARRGGPAERSLDSMLQNDLIVRVAEMPPGEDPDSVVRHKGKAEFMKRIVEARNFFDYWIAQEAADSDLTSMTAKMRLARRMAETVARVCDPIMRTDLANKVSSGIGVAAPDFEAMLPKPGREYSVAAGRSHELQARPAPRHDVAMLGLLALRDQSAREFLLGQDWRDVLSQTPDAEILSRILESDLRPDDAVSVNVFMAGLTAQEEALVSSWLLRRMPPNAVAVASDWWSGLRQAAVRRQLKIAEGRLRIPQLSAGQMTALQKQVVDLKAQLDELSAFSPAHVLEN